MNKFEKRINELRLQYRDERLSIQKDCDRTIGRLNTAIGMVNSAEARDALRAEKRRVYEACRRSMKNSRLCYRQQLELLNDEYALYLEQNPSTRQLRRMMACLCRHAEAHGLTTLSLAFGNNRRGEISFT